MQPFVVFLNVESLKTVCVISDASPELQYIFSEQTLQPGPTVSLKCVATGNPPPQFTWTLDGFQVFTRIIATKLQYKSV